MNKQQIIGIIIVVALVAGGAGYMMGRGGGVPALGGLSSSDQAKFDAAKKMFPPPPDSNFIYGQAKSVSGNVITLNTPISNPFDESPTVRQVTVTSSTKIVKNENKSVATMQQEQQAYQKKISSWKPSSTDTPPTLPMPFTEKEISISDIKAGDQLSIEAVTQIRMLEKFDATKITVQMSASAFVPGLPTVAVPPPTLPTPVKP